VTTSWSTLSRRYVPQIRLTVVNQPPSSRRQRRPAVDIDAERRTRAIADNLGRDIRTTRRRLHLTQAALGERVGVHQTWISDIELGRGAGVALAVWVAIGVALDRPLAVSLSRPIDAAERLADAGHLEIQEALAALAVATGRTASVERLSRQDVDSHSTDVAIKDDVHRVLILAEAWNTFGDLGAAIRSTHRKEIEATGRLRTSGLERVASVWVVRRSAANRALLSRYPHVFAAIFIGSSRAWVRALVDGVPPPREPGLVWFDPATRRIMPWQRNRRPAAEHPKPPAGTMHA
jgi:transcriptional regulator with XRE-family HTH domain